MPTSLPNFPLPQGDTERIKALADYAILDTLPEQAYDDITLLAGQLCSTPISLVSLVDSERQWFKSKVGLETVEMPRYIAFCAHAILNPEQLLIVTDARLDPRFAENPMVTSAPSIRFYVGAPLVTAAGHALGTLCVMDRVPRELTQQQLEALRALARQVVAHLELRRTIAQLERQHELMRQARRELEQYQRQLRDLNTQLHEQSFTDGLTGIFNRRAFALHLAKAVLDAASRHEPLSLVMLDVDHFKAFNDDFGHFAGDQVLRLVAATVQASVRKNDVLARYGGEEFVVILPGVGAELAYEMAERLCAAVRKTDWQERHVTVSAGIAALDDERSSGETLVAAADKALYEAKIGGRDRVAAFSTAETMRPATWGKDADP
jgi:diguanylate cyclase (GGDEF)-like protein